MVVVGRKSPYSLYDDKISSFEDDGGAYDQKDAAGFIKLQVRVVLLRLTRRLLPPQPGGALRNRADGRGSGEGGTCLWERGQTPGPLPALLTHTLRPGRAPLQALRLRTLAKNRGHKWNKELF